MENKEINSNILMIDENDSAGVLNEREKIWHEIQYAYHGKRLLTGIFSGIEKAEKGVDIAVVYYKDFRVVIPLNEMLENIGEGDDAHERAVRILTNMLGCEIDFIPLGIDSENYSVVASRIKAMQAKRIQFYGKDKNGIAKISEGQIVQGRVISVAEKTVRFEVFGAECTVVARDLSWEWLGDAKDKFRVGDRVLLKIESVEYKESDVVIACNVKAVTENKISERLLRCKVGGKYSGRITDIYKGVTFIKLDIGVNAVAHSCSDRRMPGKNDDISFVVTRIDTEQKVAVGIITRIIRQNI